MFDFPSISAISAHIQSRLVETATQGLATKPHSHPRRRPSPDGESSGWTGSLDSGSSWDRDGSTEGSPRALWHHHSPSVGGRPLVKLRRQITPPVIHPPSIVITVTASASRSPGNALGRMMMAAAACRAGYGGSVLNGEDGVTRIPHVRWALFQIDHRYSLSFAV